MLEVHGVLALGRNMGRTARPEKKFTDFAIGHTIVSNVGWQRVVDSFNNLAQGLEPGERVGQKIMVKNIQFNLELKNVVPIIQANLFANADAASQHFAVALILDTQSNGTPGTLTAGTIWKTEASSNSMLEMANSERFRILRKWDITLTPRLLINNFADTSQMQTWDMALIKLYKKCSIPIIQTDVGATLTNIRSNNISLWVCQQPTGDVANDFSLGGEARIRFIDN